MMIHFIKNKNKGFTLVEALVALLIFTLSILAVMAVLSSDLINIGVAKKKTTATFLAQEGIEYIRNIRDTHVLYKPDGWNSFVFKMADCDINVHPNGCYFDVERDENGNAYNVFGSTLEPITEILIDPCANSCPQFYYHLGTGVYNYIPTPDGPSDSTELVSFSRQIKMRMINLNELEIVSTVFWNQGSGTRSVSFAQSLYNWAE